MYNTLGPLYSYYLGFFENRRSNDNISIVLTTTESKPVQYSIEAPGVGYYQDGIILPSNEVILNLPKSIAVSSIHHQNKGIYLRITSDAVTVIGQHLDSRNSDSFFAVPIIQLNDSYVYYGMSVPRATVHSVAIDSSMLVVGTEDNTVMKLTGTQLVNIGMGDAVIYLIPGKEYSFVINRLQTVYIGSVEDLSGTKIVTNRPVSVFSGHACANVPRNITACSHLVEQIPPTALWGKVYYTAPLANKTSYTVKVLAASNFTTVSMYCNNTMELFALNEDQFINKTLQMHEYCAIHSNKELLVVQFSHGGSEDNRYGDPMMTLVPAANQYLNKFVFSTIHNPLQSGYDHYVNIIVKEQYYQPNMIYLTAGGVSRPLVTEHWVPIQVNNTIEAYATQLSISEGVVQLLHTSSAAQMMTIVYGFNDHDGYGHLGRFSLPKGTIC